MYICESKLLIQKLSSMNKIISCFVLITVLMLTACGPKEVEKVCTGKVRKEYSSGNVFATVEDGCIIKYQAENEFKMTGTVSLRVVGDSTSQVMKVIHLDKGKILTSNGVFVIQSSLDAVKVRLIDGSGTFDYNKKQATLEKSKMLTVGEN